MEVTFTALDQESRDETSETLKQALGPFPDVTLSIMVDRSEWRIGVSDLDKKRADKRLNQAEAAITAALMRKSNDPLSETIRFNEYRVTSGGMANLYSNEYYVSLLRKSILVGIALSAAGLLCVSLPRGPHSPPVSRLPGMISLGFFISGIWGVYLTTSSFMNLLGMAVIGVAVATGVPAMVFGLSARSSRIGRFVAALSWCAILGLCLNTFLPKRYFNNLGWHHIDVPATGAMSALPVPESPANVDPDAKRNAVRSWLETIDSGKYAEAWRLSSTLTRTVESETEWTAKIKAIRVPLGGLLARTNESTKETGGLEGTLAERYLVYTFKSDFAYKHSALETVTLIYQNDGKWRILSYSIQ